MLLPHQLLLLPHQLLLLPHQLLLLPHQLLLLGVAGLGDFPAIQDIRILRQTYLFILIQTDL
jgi:hypothetical protein